MNTKIDSLLSGIKAVREETTAKDFKSGVDVRWCAGCGSYAILSQSQKVMPDLGVPKEKVVFVSGIGCSGRFPYYMDVYGFHSIHGRALPIATGLKITRPDLSVWVATGDGDCMSIGGNHMIHACRRNIDINILMFNNEVYSLTKGQYSPTSRMGQITKTSPLGVLDNPFNPVTLALGSGATFVARGFDKDTGMMNQLLRRANEHKGVSFVEIYTNCVIYNHKAFDDYTSKETRKEKTVMLTHGQPLVFGDEHDKGIRMDGYKPEVVSLTDGRYSLDDLLVHDEKDSTLAFILGHMDQNPSMPRPMGIFQSLDRPTYDQQSENQIKEEIKQKGEGDVESLLLGDEFWTIR